MLDDAFDSPSIQEDDGGDSDSVEGGYESKCMGLIELF